ncbi:MAG: hypothetical protein JSV49_12185, partial [Thermoplasmata archaeon]
FSTDLLNWTEPHPIFPNIDGWQVWPYLVTLPNGTLFLLYDDFEKEGDHWVTYSNNDLNWSNPIEIHVELNEGCYWNIINLQVLPDGNIYALSSAGDRISHIHKSSNGINWELVGIVNGWFHSMTINSKGEFIAVGVADDFKQYSYISKELKKWIKKERIPIEIYPEIIRSNENLLYTIGPLEVSPESYPGYLGPITIITSNNGYIWSVPNILSEKKYLFKTNDLHLIQNEEGELVISYISGDKFNPLIKIIVIDPDNLVIKL